MKQFKHPNMTNFNCQICGTSADQPVVLIGIPGTENDGLIECRQVHSECYKLYCKMRGETIEIEGVENEN